ncbi:MAG: apolipoprotein N-acyltransferase [Actinomycetota bacterium]|jgi:apolipoprotein N-acyltransferase|nr:apolipoprotein N-acyltransferase [Actinomycetota bacterium]
MTRGWSLVVCICSGILLSFAFPEPSVAPLAWIAIAPLLVLARGSARKGFALGVAFGLGFFGSLLIWVSVVGWVAWAVLVVMEALYIGAFGAAWGLISRLDRRWWVLFAPALWVACETLREVAPVVGFPWGQLAQSQGVFPWLLDISQVGGGKTVSFVLLAVNVMVASAWLSRGVARVVWAAGGAAMIAAMVLLTYVIPQIDGDAPPHSSEILRVAIVQGNASPGVLVEDERARVERHMRLTQQLADDHIDLVVWPESAVGIDPFLDADVKNMVSNAARSVGAPMIVGANIEDGPDHYKVEALLVDAQGNIIDEYQKTHLVPFGEYVPARDAFGWIPMLDQIPRDAVAGHDPNNLEVGGHEIATVISFEGDFGHIVRDRVADGAGLIVVATNTSTWKHSWASAQHLAMSQVRAAETRVPVVHAALSGISGFVSFQGLVGNTTELYTEDTLVADISTAADISIYARTGEWLPWSCIVISLVGMLYAFRRRPTGTVPA